MYNQTQKYKIIPKQQAIIIFFYSKKYLIFVFIVYNNTKQGLIMIKIGDRIAYLRRQKGWSQTDLAKKTQASREAIGKYERNEAVPSVETAKKIADAFSVTLDYLVDETAASGFDKQTVNRIRSIEQLKADDKSHLFAVMDAFLRDVKTKQAYL